MLCLSRTPGESLVLDGGRIVVTVVDVKGDKVKLGITAPRDVRVDREEIHAARQAGEAIRLRQTR